MSNRRIGLIWLVGILLAVVVYAAGPDQFLDAAWVFALNAELAVRNLQLSLSASAYDLVRATAIGLFVVFLLLAGLATHRGLRARGALVVVSILFLALISNPAGSGPRWVGALVLVAIGSAVMTRRLSP